MKDGPACNAIVHCCQSSDIADNLSMSRIKLLSATVYFRVVRKLCEVGQRAGGLNR